LYAAGQAELESAGVNAASRTKKRAQETEQKAIAMVQHSLLPIILTSDDAVKKWPQECGTCGYGQQFAFPMVATAFGLCSEVCQRM
jgi:hypothetical protein